MAAKGKKQVKPTRRRRPLKVRPRNRPRTEFRSIISGKVQYGLDRHPEDGEVIIELGNQPTSPSAP